MLTVRLVPRGHYLLGKPKYKPCPPPAQLTPDAARFWKDSALDGCDRAVAAYSKGILVGFLRFNTHRGRHIEARGTWVAPALRGSGIGSRLWHHVLRRLRVRTVTVHTISPGGWWLINKLISQHPDIGWDTSDSL